MLVATAVYYACIAQRCPRSVSEVSAVAAQSSKKISKMFQVMSKNAGGGPLHNVCGTDPTGEEGAGDKEGIPSVICPGNGNDDRSVVLSRVLPEDVVGRLASLLHLPGPLICIMREVCAKVTKLQLTDGTSAQAVAAAVIVLVVLGKKQQQMDDYQQLLSSLDKICIVSFCSLPVIQRAYGLIRPHAVLILPTDFVKSTGGVQHIPVDMPRLGD